MDSRLKSCCFPRGTWFLRPTQKLFPPGMILLSEDWSIQAQCSVMFDVTNYKLNRRFAVQIAQQNMLKLWSDPIYTNFLIFFGFKFWFPLRTLIIVQDENDHQTRLSQISYATKSLLTKSILKNLIDRLDIDTELVLFCVYRYNGETSAAFAENWTWKCLLVLKLFRLHETIVKPWTMPCTCPLTILCNLLIKVQTLTWSVLNFWLFSS